MAYKLHLTYQEFENLIWHLIEKIGHVNQNRFDAVIGVANGGVPISRFIADYYKITHSSIRISCYDGEVKRKEPIIDFGIADTNKRYLIVDDLIDSGQTYQIIKKHFTKSKFACLYVNNDYNDKPDYYVLDKPASTWIVFPHEQKEQNVTLRRIQKNSSSQG